MSPREGGGERGKELSAVGRPSFVARLVELLLLQTRAVLCSQDGSLPRIVETDQQHLPLGGSFAHFLSTSETRAHGQATKSLGIASVRTHTVEGNACERKLYKTRFIKTTISSHFLLIKAPYDVAEGDNLV